MDKAPRVYFKKEVLTLSEHSCSIKYMKNPSAVNLGKLSAKAREGKTDYSALGKKTWANVSAEERKLRMQKVRNGRTLTKK